MNNKNTIEVSATLPFSYQHIPVAGADKNTPVALFLHGYTDSGRALLRRALRDQSVDFHVLAPNGPFPVPVKTDKGYKEAFAWYFWDFQAHKMIISPEIAVKALNQLISHFGYENHPKIIVGFSQGGFLMPFLYPALTNVKGMIGVGCAYRTVNYPDQVNCPVIAVHGAQDEIVTLDSSQNSFEDLVQQRKIQGEYYVLSHLGHTIDEKASALILQKIADLTK